MDYHKVEAADGDLVMSSGVISTIVVTEASKTAGVVALGDASTKELPHLLARGAQPKGIAVEIGSGEVAAALRIRVKYGAKIPDLANRMRNRIAEAVKAITGYTVRGVDITVEKMELPG